MLPYTFPVKVVMNAFEATTLPLRVVAEMVNALMVLDPKIWPYMFEATTLPLRVVAEMVNALMVFDP
jgi:hypothetical protein